MLKKVSFPELKCSGCEYLQCVGSGLIVTRYCKGFPKRRKPKRFSASDPKAKAPKWCPRRIWPPVCRIYGFADEQSRDMDLLTREYFDPQRNQYISVSAWHYRPRLETTVSMKAGDLFNRVKHGDADDFFTETGLQLGEIVEIDDGLTPYYFYCWSWSRLIPVFHFDRSRAQEGV